ncbi:hypothetical protein KY285_026330 [Solanum tuberosum]|nr:hypothetical protein KY289_026592 [Solanum tuberosum]KAH0665124.1 hypothetical protein KY285_026330 [Solanum tuberosum]
MPVAWGNPTGLQIKEIGWNFFQFKFKDKEIWNIPLHWMSMGIGRKIGNALGGIVDIVIPKNGSKEGQYIRLKARMNITKPLPRAENHAPFSEKCRRQGTNNTNGSPVVNVRRVERIVNSLQHLEKGVEVVHTQGQNEPKGKEITGLSRKDNNVLNMEDLNQMQPMEVTNYGSHEKEFGGGRDNAGEDNYVRITTISKHVLNMASKKNDMSSQNSANEKARFTPITRTLQTRLHRLHRTLELCALIPSLSRLEPTPWEDWHLRTVVGPKRTLGLAYYSAEDFTQQFKTTQETFINQT